MSAFDIEQIRDASSPDEMRAEIYRLQHYDYLVRHIMQHANYSGISAEDRYTMLAYYAIKGKNKAESELLHMYSITISPPIVTADAPVKRKGGAT